MKFLLRTPGCAAVGLWSIAQCCASIDADSAPNDQKPPEILVNHVGFLAQGAKHCLVAGGAPVTFEIIDTENSRMVFTGRTEMGGADLGSWQIGDFSKLRRSGGFQVRAGNQRSGAFVIGRDAYEDAPQKSVKYFSRQRCGPGETGYHAPCHLNDGRRRDNGRHQDVTGGWHAACDLRKWVDATIFGMIGLDQVAELRHPRWGRSSIPAEMRWGNRYFLAMQEPAGYVMNYGLLHHVVDQRT